MNYDNFELNWKVTSEESKERGRKFLWFAIPIILFIAVNFSIGFVFEVDMSNDGITKTSMFIILMTWTVFSIVLVFLYNRFHKYKDKQYNLNQDGINIVNGKVNIFYKWSECTFFYCNMPIIEDNNYSAEKLNKNKKMLKNIAGLVFYIKLKPRSYVGKLFKHGDIIVMYSEPDNYNEVYDILRHFLKEDEKQLPGFGKMLYR